MKLSKGWPFILPAMMLLGFQNCSQNYEVAQNTSVQSLSAEQVESACRATTLKRRTMRITLPDPGECQWNQNGNGTKEPAGESFLRARQEQIVTSDIPSGAKICGLNFHESSQNITYDDQLLFHINGNVFASSYDQIVGLLEERNGLRVYDWSKLSNQFSDPRGNTVYCLGQSQGISNCQIPRSEAVGRLRLTMDQQVLYRLSAAIPEGENLKLGVVTFGDNDANDCRHSPIEFDLDVDYVD